MQLRTVTLVSLIAALVFSLTVFAQQQPSPVRGVWQLIEVIPAGEATGQPAQPGQYMFSDSHYSFTRVTANEPRKPVADRAQFAEMTVDQFRDLTQFVGEAGTYEAKGSELVIHRTVALIPGNMVPGNAATFSFDVRGDILTMTPVTRVDGKPLQNNATLKFRRLE